MGAVNVAVRAAITDMLRDLKQEIDGAKPPVVQELVLAQRHLEDARMRLGVAEAYEKGFDPWSNQVSEKDNTKPDGE